MALFGRKKKDEAPEVQTEEKKTLFKKMFSGLDKTRKSILGGIDRVVNSFTKIDEDLLEELEEALISADISAPTAMELVETLRKRIKAEGLTDPEQLKAVLIDEISEILAQNESEFELKSPSAIIVVGVNGVGKTTTIGKLASVFKSEGKSVIIAAADTFRAAAIDQLEAWAKRSDTPLIKHQENSDPASVVYDAVHAAQARKADILICDTAGRLQNKKNLMEELKKITNIINREYRDAQIEVLIVLDATTGQNAISQVQVFNEICNLTGIVMTKLDGTAKGGILISIKNELNVPVRFVGFGEGVEDLRPFDAQAYAAALFGETE